MTMSVPLDTLFGQSAPQPDADIASFERELIEFRWYGRKTLAEQTPSEVEGRTLSVNTFVNEVWTRRQRAAHSLHEVS